MSESELPRGFEGVDRVVLQPLKFKAQLRIGEEAYRSLQAGRAVSDLWNFGTAAATGGFVAGSPVVASTFFGTSLTALGIGTAVTPVGWVVGGAVAAGALSWGVLRMWRGYSASRVEIVPRFINTPIDLLAASLFDLVAGLAILVAREAGELDPGEREGIADYFTSEWGLDPNYIRAALPVLEVTTVGRTVDEAAKALAALKRQNPDCNYEAMSEELVQFLIEIAEADGAVDDGERRAIESVRRVLAAENSWGIWATAATAAEAISSAPRALWRSASDVFSRPPDEALPSQVPGRSEALPVPTLWLLGKTGAGKSSLVRAMTKVEDAEIGNGFVSCTRTARSYDFPAAEPVMRFLDTRGLGEVDYDPAADLQTMRKSANVALVVLRLDDPVQGRIAEAVARVRKESSSIPVVVVHTAGDLVEGEEARARARGLNHTLIEKAWGGPLPSVVLDLGDPAHADLTPLAAELVKVLPSVAMFLASEAAEDEEGAAFLGNRTLVLAYAGSATATGALPIIGTASVPALQLAMLSMLAKRYGIDWNARRLAELASALGMGVLGAQAIGFAAREASKLVPVFGQTVAPITAAGWGFASTYALGRASAWWFYRLKNDQPIDPEELRERFLAAMKGAAA